MDCNRGLRIDLHIHSTASDGTLTPSEIVAAAKKQGLAAISITDHDTLAGSREALEIGERSFDFLTGVEISAAPPPGAPCSGSFHILGYGIDLDEPLLNQTLTLLQNARRNRNPAIIQRLVGLGFDISMDEVCGIAGNAQIGRPHIALAMLQKGFVGSIDEAFDRYLGHGQPAYVDKYRIPCAQALQIIRNAGGIPVLAHPFLLNIQDRHQMEQLIASLVSMGLIGIEVFYPEHPPEATAFYQELAERFGLLMTGGTDFHGNLNPEIRMGCANGDFSVPYELYRQLVGRLAETGSAVAPAAGGGSDSGDLQSLCRNLKYDFHDAALIREALCHSSFANEQADPRIRDNERFEFLGDAVLNLIVGHRLMQRYPHLREGELSRMRANLVNEVRLADVARNLDLGPHIQLGRGERQTGGQDKNSILANTFEAVVAAVYLDGGFDVAFNVVDRHMGALLDAEIAAETHRDYKSRLQELVQLLHHETPNYQVIFEEGPDHDKTFGVEMRVRDLKTEGTGKSKKLAEQDAARKALEILQKPSSGP
ncbi:MAG TPA: ribonuclease III [Desulfobacterales bacterium]